MIHDGYEIYVAEDCCGDVSQLAHDNAMRRLSRPAQSPSPSLPRCWSGSATGRSAHTYDAVMDVVKVHLGAYGIGVEYAYTMVHGARPTVFSGV